MNKFTAQQWASVRDRLSRAALLLALTVAMSAVISGCSSETTLGPSEIADGNHETGIDDGADSDGVPNSGHPWLGRYPITLGSEPITVAANAPFRVVSIRWDAPLERSTPLVLEARFFRFDSGWSQWSPVPYNRFGAIYTSIVHLDEPAVEVQIRKPDTGVVNNVVVELLRRLFAPGEGEAW